MCLSVPRQIIKIKNGKAIVSSGGKSEEVATQLMSGSGLKPGDFCLVSNGFIIKKLSAKEAEEILKIIKPAGGEAKEEGS